MNDASMHIRYDAEANEALGQALKAMTGWNVRVERDDDAGTTFEATIRGVEIDEDGFQFLALQTFTPKDDAESASEGTGETRLLNVYDDTLTITVL